MSDTHRAATATNPLARRLGFWSAVTAFLTFVVYVVCFVAILSSSPVFTWTTLDNYLAYDETYGGPFQPLAQLAMLVFGLSLVVLLHAVHESTDPARRVLVRISATFASLFAVSIGIHYFTQITAVRLNLLAGQTEGLQYFVQANPHAILSAINMLGWTVFLGLASLFAAPVFSGTVLERVVRIALLLNALFCFGGALGYAWVIDWLTFVTINLGMGGAVMVVTGALALWFRRQPA